MSHLLCRFNGLEELEAHIKTCPEEEKAALLAQLNEMATKALEAAAPKARSGKSLWGRAKVMIPVCTYLPCFHGPVPAVNFRLTHCHRCCTSKFRIIVRVGSKNTERHPGTPGAAQCLSCTQAQRELIVLH